MAHGPAFTPSLPLPQGISSLPCRPAAELDAEIRRVGTASSDLGFDLRAIEIIRSRVLQPSNGAPYPQLGTPTSMIVRWCTDATHDQVVGWNRSPRLDATIEKRPARDRTRPGIKGIGTRTKCSYGDGNSTTVIVGNDADHFFEISLPVGSRDPAGSTIRVTRTSRRMPNLPSWCYLVLRHADSHIEVIDGALAFLTSAHLHT